MLLSKETEPNVCRKCYLIVLYIPIISPSIQSWSEASLTNCSLLSPTFKGASRYSAIYTKLIKYTEQHIAIYMFPIGPCTRQKLVLYVSS